jgi:type VI protein secretion system component Hcp
MPLFSLNRRSAMRVLVALPAALALSPVLQPAEAAIDSYMGFSDASIKGDGPGGSIEIESFSFSSQAPVTSTGTGGTGRASHGTATITRNVDRTSPMLAAAFASGKHFPQLSVTFHGQTTTFTDVTIISTLKGGSTESPTETVTFGFGALQIPYSPSPSPKPTKKP